MDHPIFTFSLIISSMKFDPIPNSIQINRINSTTPLKTSLIFFRTLFPLQLPRVPILLIVSVKISNKRSQPLPLRIQPKQFQQLNNINKKKTTRQMDQQIHLMLLKVCVQKIQLPVRFPCSLTFQMKVQSKSVECKGSYQLLKGACAPDETLRLEVQLEKRQDDTYRDRQAKIIIYMTSANGKTPAGSVTLPLNTLKVGSPTTQTTPIEKCPDKSATITLTHSLDFLRAITKSNSNYKSSIFSAKEQSSISSASRIRYSGSPQVQVENFRSPVDKYKFTQRKGSVHTASYQVLARSGVGDRERDRDRDRDRELEYEDKRGSRVTGFVEDGDTEKIVALQKQRSEHIKQISKLQRQISRKNLQQKTHSQQHYNRLKSQLNEMLAQNQSLKQKQKSLERYTKEQAQIIKELKQDLQRKKQKNYQQEFNRMESQSLLDEKDKLIRELQGQIKGYEEEVHQLRIGVTTQQKRGELREASFREQIGKVNQKYQMSQMERQKAVIDLNTMLQQLQSTQKKHQQICKQKDKTHAEQKNKLVKKSESLSRIIEQQKQQLEQKSTQILDLQREIKILQTRLADLDAEVGELRASGRDLGYQLEREREGRRDLERELEKMGDANGLYQDLKKKYQQLQSQLQTARKSHQSATKTLQNTVAKSKQTQQSLSQKSQQISSLMTKIFTLTSQLQSSKKQHQNSLKEIQTLTSNNLNAANKIQELRMKVEQLQFGCREIQDQTQEQIGYMLKTKQYLEAELDEARWNLEKVKDSNDELNQKNKALSNTILELNRKTMQQQQKITRLQQSLSESKSTIQLQSQSQTLQSTKQKQLQQKLKQQNNELYELSKKLSKSQRDHSLSLQKLKQTQKHLTQKLQAEQLSNMNKEAKIAELGDLVGKLQVELLAKDELIAGLGVKISKLQMECQYLSEQVRAGKKEVGDLEDALGMFKEEVIGVTDKLNAVTQTLEKEIGLKNQALQNLAKKNKQFEDYRNAMNTALQQLFQQIPKDYNPTDAPIPAAFPNETQSTLQSQSLKKKSALLQKYQSQIHTLQSSLRYLQQQVAKSKKNHTAREEQLEQMLEQEKGRFKGIIAELGVEKQDLLDKIGLLEEKLSEVVAEGDRIGAENQENKAVIAQQESYISQLNFQIENYKNQIKGLQQSLKAQKQQHQKTKSAFENSLLTTTEQSTIQSQKLKKLLLQSQRKSTVLSQTLLQKQQQINRLQANLENVTHLKEKLEQKFTELTDRFGEVVAERKAGLETQRGYERAVRKLEERGLGLEAEITQLNQKIQSYLIDKKKIQEALSQEQLLSKKLMGQLELAVLNSKQLQTALKDSQQKAKKSLQKWTQQQKKLKQQVITLSSALQLKTFELSQTQSTTKSQKSTLSDLTQQLQSKKQDLTLLQSKLQQSKNTNILVMQQLETVLSEKSSLENQVRSLKETLINLEEVLNQNQSNLDTLVLKDREIVRLKEEVSGKDRAYQRNLADMKMQVNQAKKEIAVRAQRQEQYKKKIRQLQSQIETILYDAETQKKSWQETSQNQRRQLEYQLEGVKQQNKLLAEEFQFQREQMNHQLDQATQEISQLKQVISQSQFQIENSGVVVGEMQEKIRKLEGELKACREEWQKEKLAYIPTAKQFKQIQNQIAKYQKYAVQLQKKNKQLTEIAKKRLTEDQKSSCGDLLRQINTLILRNKSKILNRVGERQREQVVADFKQIHEKLESAIKSNLIYK